MSDERLNHEPECPNFKGDCCPWVDSPYCGCQCICDILRPAYERGRRDERLHIVLDLITELPEVYHEYEPTESRQKDTIKLPRTESE